MKHTNTFNALMLLACVTLTGCGTAAYEKEQAKTLAALRLETPFTPLWDKPADDLPSKSLSLRIPKVFRPNESYVLNPLTMLTPDPRRPDDVVDPYRVLPDYLRSRDMAKTLYGHQRTYEGFVQVTSQQSLDKIVRPFYLYVFFMPKEEGKLMSARELERDLRDKLIKKFGKKDVSEWESVEPAPVTPAGGTMTWRRLKASGEQYWAAYEDKVARYKIYSGDLVLYLHSTPDYHVVLGWRCAPNVADSILLNQIAPICAGTVKVE